jgi:hypothetical protein
MGVSELASPERPNIESHGASLFIVLSPTPGLLARTE